MNTSRLQFAAGGGVLDRRTFIASGLSLLTATAIASADQTPAPYAGAADEPIAEHFPEWMTTLGADDTPYGLPTAQERHVTRERTEVAKGLSGFTAWHTPIDKLRGTITPNGLHFGVHHNGIPNIPAERHELLIHGLVRRPLKFSLEHLLRYPMVSRVHFLECAGNTAHNALSPSAVDAGAQALFGQASCAEWTGVPLSILLAEAGLEERAAWVVAEGADGGCHARSVPLVKATGDAMLALFQNGERLRAAQGYPLRLFLPGWEGNTNVKWLRRLEVTEAPAYTKDESGLYTEIRSDHRIARFAFHMGVKSVITSPAGAQTLSERGFYEISGLAWSGHGRIARVEVSADGGKSWTAAALQEPVLDRAFTRFSIPWAWSGAPACLLSRATDECGHTQPSRTEWKARYARHSFNHYNAVQCWRVARDGHVENAYA
jgi:sulfane dehydrogenase subunit SoxC